MKLIEPGVWLQVAKFPTFLAGERMVSKRNTPRICSRLTVHQLSVNCRSEAGRFLIECWATVGQLLLATAHLSRSSSLFFVKISRDPILNQDFAKRRTTAAERTETSQKKKKIDEYINCFFFLTENLFTALSLVVCTEKNERLISKEIEVRRRSGRKSLKFGIRQVDIGEISTVKT